MREGEVEKRQVREERSRQRWRDEENVRIRIE